MKHLIPCLTAAILGLGASMLHAAAADLGQGPLDEPPAAAMNASDWTFTAATYVWASGISGETGMFGFPAQDIDVSFKDILENLDLAFMGAGEARNGPFSIGVDLSWARLSADIESPLGIAASEIDVTSTTLMATGMLGYAIVDTGTMHVDAMAGARLWSMNTEFEFDGGRLDGRSADDGATWVDPVIGAKFKADLGANFYASGWGMIGGFGVASDLMWDVMGGVGYNVTDSFSVFAGYRALGVDYSDDGFVYDVIQDGPLMAGVLRF